MTLYPVHELTLHIAHTDAYGIVRSTPHALHIQERKCDLQSPMRIRNQIW